ncbi:MAG: hypothetical protein BWX79_00310 [Alphaproteobacteria bacterium ADurb.Bin100]|nr:MAG: hypothetical protein BWX79_00310 [Alphaproteobacteria bacterium ADurb.Bin100]
MKGRSYFHSPHPEDHDQANPFLPGRSRSAAAPGDPFAVLEQGNLPARVDLQRVGRLRQAAFRGYQRRWPVRERRRTQGEARLRQGREDADHYRQRHRHERAGGHRAPRHHRQERHQGFRQQAQRRPEGRLPAHRPVRRGLLLGLHRGRQDHRRIPPSRYEGDRRRALGQRRRRRLRGRNHHPRRTRHQRDPAPARRRHGLRQQLEVERHRQQVLRPHQPAHRDGKGRVERRRADHTR